MVSVSATRRLVSAIVVPRPSLRVLRRARPRPRPALPRPPYAHYAHSKRAIRRASSARDSLRMTGPSSTNAVLDPCPSSIVNPAGRSSVLTLTHSFERIIPLPSASHSYTYSHSRLSTHSYLPVVQEEQGSQDSSTDSGNAEVCTSSSTSPIGGDENEPNRVLRSYRHRKCKSINEVEEAFLKIKDGVELDLIRAESPEISESGSTPSRYNANTKTLSTSIGTWPRSRSPSVSLSLSEVFASLAFSGSTSTSGSASASASVRTSTGSVTRPASTDTSASSAGAVCGSLGSLTRPISGCSDNESASEGSSRHVSTSGDRASQSEASGSYCGTQDMSFSVDSAAHVKSVSDANDTSSRNWDTTRSCANDASGCDSSVGAGTGYTQNSHDVSALSHSVLDISATSFPHARSHSHQQAQTRSELLPIRPRARTGYLRPRTVSAGGDSSIDSPAGEIGRKKRIWRVRDPVARFSDPRTWAFGEEAAGGDGVGPEVSQDVSTEVSQDVSTEVEVDKTVSGTDASGSASASATGTGTGTTRYWTAEAWTSPSPSPSPTPSPGTTSSPEHSSSSSPAPSPGYGVASYGPARTDDSASSRADTSTASSSAYTFTFSYTHAHPHAHARPRLHRARPFAPEFHQQQQQHERHEWVWGLSWTEEQELMRRDASHSGASSVAMEARAGPLLVLTTPTPVVPAPPSPALFGGVGASEERWLAVPRVESGAGAGPGAWVDAYTNVYEIGGGQVEEGVSADQGERESEATPTGIVGRVVRRVLGERVLAETREATYLSRRTTWSFDLKRRFNLKFKFAPHLKFVKGVSFGFGRSPFAPRHDASASFPSPSYRLKRARRIVSSLRVPRRGMRKTILSNIRLPRVRVRVRSRPVSSSTNMPNAPPDASTSIIDIDIDRRPANHLHAHAPACCPRTYDGNGTMPAVPVYPSFAPVYPAFAPVYPSFVPANPAHARYPSFVPVAEHLFPIPGHGAPASADRTLGSGSGSGAVHGRFVEHL
ncbi:hypothetical protein EIP86_002062 [Pleurotus ostreatoroseus]|nr:hypothetical protein EIP86_002062 [Pleurotus ostreatoroseus]